MLYKLASKKKKKGNMYEAAAVGVAAPILASAGIDGGVSKSFKLINKNLPNPELNNNRVKEIYKHVGGNKNISFQETFSNKDGDKAEHLFVNKGNRNPFGSMYLQEKVPGKKKVSTVFISDHSPESIVAHEMGHSTSKFLNSKAGLYAYAGSKVLTPLVGIGAGIRYARARANGASKAELNKIKNQDDITAATTSLPIVGEETRANLIGLRTMKRMGQLNKRNLIPLALSEASYLSLPTLTPLAHKIVDKYYDWKQKK